MSDQQSLPLGWGQRHHTLAFEAICSERITIEWVEQHARERADHLPAARQLLGCFLGDEGHFASCGGVHEDAAQLPDSSRKVVRPAVAMDVGDTPASVEHHAEAV